MKFQQPKTQLVFTLFAVLFYNLAFTQFTPDYSNNYHSEKAAWNAFYDSISVANGTSADSAIKAAGYNRFHRWVNFWEQFMPEFGDYAEANELFKACMHQQQAAHFQKLQQAQGGGGSSQIPTSGPNTWQEIGPLDPSKIKEKISGNWISPHINNNGSTVSYAHQAEIDLILLHPTNPDIIYACAPASNLGSTGGLFRSTDGGLNWSLLNTDQIPYCDVRTFEIKPASVTPLSGTEVLFIGLKTGAVYRSTDDGNTWVEAGYNGNRDYPYLFNTQNDTSSLPYSFDFINYGYERYQRNFKFEFAPASANAGSYSRLLVGRHNGLYYSDNYTASIVISSSGISLNNSISWTKVNLDNILNSISFHHPSATHRDFAINDVEYYSKNGSDYYLALVQIRELAGDPELDNDAFVYGHWQYLIQSSDYGATWSFVGGQSSSNSANGAETWTYKLNSFYGGNIECHTVDPNFIYVASVHPGVTAFNQGYQLHKYNFSSWQNLSITSGFTSNANAIHSQPNAFLIDPTNDSNWWFFTNGISRQYNGASYLNNFGYSTHHHADARNAKVLPNGDLIMGHDGGVGISTDNGLNFSVVSNGMNSAASDKVIITQAPPFYVASGFWHSGFHIYNPKTQEWHMNGNSDGGAGKGLFLNSEIFSWADQNAKYHVFKNYDQLNYLFSNVNNSGGLSGLTQGRLAGSENRNGRVYQVLRNNTTNSKIYYSNNDLVNLYTLPNMPVYPPHDVTLEVVPNNPDLLVVVKKNDNTNVTANMYFYSGMDAAIPNPVLERDIDLHAVFDPTFQDSSKYVGVTFDPRGNGDCWIVLKGDALWQNAPRRIVKYTYSTDSFDDITFVTDDAIPGQTPSFPNFIQINSIVLDRQIDRVYIGTNMGVYYLDEQNSIWKKHSKNIPAANTSIDVLHCKGEIYASCNGRGLWKSDLVRDDLSEPSTWDISSNQTWDDRVNLFNTLVIKTGAKLTLTGEIFVFGDQKIIVEPGAELIVDGGRITTWCGEFWHGIQVMGDRNLSQTAANQGKITTKNGAIIENARSAIQTWKKDEWATTGGIVNLSNTTFKNNHISVFFYPYHRILSNGLEVVNVGKISNCSFEWDDDYFDGRPYAGITLYDVAGVQIQGNDFTDNRTILGPNDRRAAGIYSLDAAYKVTARKTSLPQSQHDIFGTSGGYDVNTFVNLREGVRAMGANSVHSITVDHASFLNNRNPLTMLCVNNSIATRNLVNFDNTHPSDILNSGGFQFGNSSGYHVEGNTFVSNVTGTPKMGISMWESGPENNKVYRNYLNNLSVPLYAQGINSNTDALINQDISLQTGLYWKCNQMDIGQIDLADYVLPGIDGQGMKLSQGGLSESAGNRFTSVLDAPDRHILHTDNYNLRYFYNDDNDPRQQPSINTTNVDLIDVGPQPVCVSTINTIINTGGGVVLSASNLLQVQSGLVGVNSTLLSKRNSLKSSIEDGDTEELHDEVAILDHNPANTLSLLNAQSPFLSPSILQEVGAFVPDYVGYDEYFGLIVNNIEATYASDLMTYLSEFKWDAGYLSNLLQLQKNTFTARGELEYEIVHFAEQREELTNWLIMHHQSDSTIDWTAVRTHIETRGNAAVLAQLADERFSHGDLQGCSNLLDSLDATISGFALSTQQIEMQDYSLFKRYLLTVVDTNGVLRSVPDSVLSHLQYFSQNLTGSAARQAQNLMCFHRDLCEELIVDFSFSAKTVESIDLSEQKYFRLPSLKIIPNPNNGRFAVEVPESCTIETLSVWDIQGRAVSFTQEEQKGTSATVLVVSGHSGVFMIRATCKDGSVYSTRIVINN